MKARWLERTILQAPNLMLCTTPEQFASALRRLRSDPTIPFQDKGGTIASVHTLTDNAGGLVCLVTFVDTGQTAGELAGIFAHEAFHVWRALCREIGEDNPGDEITAYAVQNITERLWDDLARQRAGA